MLYPVLPLFVTRELRGPASVVGVIEGVAEATQNIVQGASGWAADRLRRDKPVALVGYALAALAKPFIGLSTVWPQVLVGRFVDRAGTGIRSAPRDALIAGSIEEARRGSAFGLEGFGDNLGAVVGPLLAAALLYLLNVDLRVIFLVAAIPGLVAFALVTRVREPKRFERTSGGRLTIREIPASYWRYLIAVGAFAIGNVSRAFMILRATDVGLAPERTLLAYAGYNLVAALVSYPAGDLADRLGPKRVLVGAVAVFAIAFVGFAVASNGLAVAVLFALYGVHQGTFRAVGKTLAVELVPASLRASGVGLYGATVGLGALVASGLGGQLWDRLGPGATFGYGAACAIVGTIALAVMVPSRREASS